MCVEWNWSWVTSEYHKSVSVWIKRPNCIEKATLEHKDKAGLVFFTRCTTCACTSIAPILHWNYSLFRSAQQPLSSHLSNQKHRRSQACFTCFHLNEKAVKSLRQNLNENVFYTDNSSLNNLGWFWNNTFGVFNGYLKMFLVNWMKDNKNSFLYLN